LSFAPSPGTSGRSSNAGFRSLSMQRWQAFQSQQPGQTSRARASSRLALRQRRCEHGCLTPPSSGRPKGRFAPFGPPLMSNVRHHQEHMSSWLRRVYHWLAEVPTFWAFLVVLTFAGGLPLLLVTPAADAIRYAGLVLQVVGVGVVAYTLRGRGKPFGHAPVLTFALEWIHRAPRFPPRTITLEVSGTASASASASADASVWRGPRLDQPIEAQLEDIRESIATLQGQVERQGSRTNARLSELQNAIDAERTQRSTQIQETKRILQEVATDSLYLEVAGVAWLVIGIVMATIPAELSALFNS
jgi:hypothetical protein